MEYWPVFFIVILYVIAWTIGAQFSKIKFFHTHESFDFFSTFYITEPVTGWLNGIVTFYLHHMYVN